jgi:hypothetical protein
MLELYGGSWGEVGWSVERASRNFLPRSEVKAFRHFPLNFVPSPNINVTCANALWNALLQLRHWRTSFLFSFSPFRDIENSASCSASRSPIRETLDTHNSRFEPYRSKYSSKSVQGTPCIITKERIFVDHLKGLNQTETLRRLQFWSLLDSVQ